MLIFIIGYFFSSTFQSFIDKGTAVITLSCLSCRSSGSHVSYLYLLKSSKQCESSTATVLLLLVASQVQHNTMKSLKCIFNMSASFAKTCSLTIYLIQMYWSRNESKSCRTMAVENWSCRPLVYM